MPASSLSSAVGGKGLVLETVASGADKHEGSSVRGLGAMSLHAVWTLAKTPRRTTPRGAN